MRRAELVQFLFDSAKRIRDLAAEFGGTQSSNLLDLARLIESQASDLARRGTDPYGGASCYGIGDP
jgi:hypothetical protein